MISFLTEWAEAPGVKDPVLASTWARLEIQANDEAIGERWPSSVISVANNSVRRGVYGALFSLAEWAVENWWFLLWEPSRVPDFSSGRQLASDPLQRAWIQRHNLLAAREGGALPDLTIYRDGEQVVARWVPDPKQDERIRPVRFIDEGEVRFANSGLESGLQQLVEAVIDRLGSSGDEDSRRLRENWAALCESRRREPELCAWSASLGIDPYDDAQLTDAMIELMETGIRPLSPKLRNDLLEAATPATLLAQVDWVRDALDQGLRHDAQLRGQNGNSHVYSTAFDLGYERARAFRDQFNLPPEPILDLPEVLQRRCGWPNQFGQTLEGTTVISAIVGKDSAGGPRVIGPSLGHIADRFKLARSVFFLPDAEQDIPPRLVTKAYTWDQRASRAFAAELLAPAECLRSVVSEAVSGDQIDELAHEFKVSPMTIEHQLANHRIAWIEGF